MPSRPPPDRHIRNRRARDDRRDHPRSSRLVGPKPIEPRPSRRPAAPRGGLRQWRLPEPAGRGDGGAGGTDDHRAHSPWGHLLSHPRQGKQQQCDQYVGGTRVARGGRVDTGRRGWLERRRAAAAARAGHPCARRPAPNHHHSAARGQLFDHAPGDRHTRGPCLRRGLARRSAHGASEPRDPSRARGGLAEQRAAYRVGCTRGRWLHHAAADESEIRRVARHNETNDGSVAEHHPGRR